MSDIYGDDIITITDEDGVEYVLEVLATMEVDGVSYYALVPASSEEDEDLEVSILKAVEEESGSEASAKELIEIIDLVKVNNLPAIFTECNGSTAAAKVISAETGSTVYELDMAMAGDSYFDAMYHNIRTVKEALG